MQYRAASILAAISIVSTAAPAQSQMTPEAAAAIQRPVTVERAEEVTDVPLLSHMGKLAIAAEANGTERQFVFDTGSPSMISRELAGELGLKAIGTNTGRDANGREHTTEVAILEELRIGSVTFRDVPVLISDFSTADPHRCFFDGGVIGSEIFPGSAWHIDADRQSLQIAGTFEELAGGDLAAPAITAPLHDFGYPHAPIFDYSIGRLTDRGLFDTGSSDTVVLFGGVAGDERVRRALVEGSIREGRGSHGVSAAGPGEETDLLLFEIDGMRLGETPLGRQPGTIRAVPPTLLGLGLLATHDVTLDYPGKRMLLHPRSRPEAEPSHPGFAMMMVGAEVRVTQLFEGSAAQRAGLRLGDEVVAVDGAALFPEEAPCETMRFLVETGSARSARALTVLRDGQPVRIELDG